MNGTEVILTLVLTRIVVPVLILLVIGEWVRRRESNYWSRS
jgi:hypothetical protein